jgi:hypothetical protein
MFRNRHTGLITIGQFPNVALWVFLAAVALRWVVARGTGFRTVVDWIGSLALVWWALDEVFRGVNPWRRLLGAGASVVAIAAIATMLF